MRYFILLATFSSLSLIPLENAYSCGGLFTDSVSFEVLEGPAGTPLHRGLQIRSAGETIVIENAHEFRDFLEQAPLKAQQKFIVFALDRGLGLKVNLDPLTRQETEDLIRSIRNDYYEETVRIDLVRLFGEERGYVTVDETGQLKIDKRGKTIGDYLLVFRFLPGEIGVRVDVFVEHIQENQDFVHRLSRAFPSKEGPVHFRGAGPDGALGHKVTARSQRNWDRVGHLRQSDRREAREKLPKKARKNNTIQRAGRPDNPGAIAVFSPDSPRKAARSGTADLGTRVASGEKIYLDWIYDLLIPELIRRPHGNLGMSDVQFDVQEGAAKGIVVANHFAGSAASPVRNVNNNPLGLKKKRADIYSVAAILYKAATGELPHAVTSPISASPLRPVHELNPKVNALLGRAIDRALRAVAEKDLSYKLQDLADDLKNV